MCRLISRRGIVLSSRIIVHSSNNGSRLPRRCCSVAPAFKLWCMNRRPILHSNLVNPILGLCLGNFGSLRAVTAFCVLRLAFCTCSIPHFSDGAFNIVLPAHVCSFSASVFPFGMLSYDGHRYVCPPGAIFSAFDPSFLSLKDLRCKTLIGTGDGPRVACGRVSPASFAQSQMMLLSVPFLAVELSVSWRSTP